MTPTCKVCLGACQSTQPEVIQVSMYSIGPGALLLPPGWDASPSQGYPPSPFSLSASSEMYREQYGEYA